MDIPLDITFDASRSIAELEEPDWTFDPDTFGAPPQAVALVTKPVRRLTPAELMQLIHWNVSLRFTVPAALARMMGDPFMKAARHEGDLLVTLLEADSRFWRANYELWAVTVGLLAAAINEVTARVESQEASENLAQFLGDDFMHAVVHFRDLHEK